MDEALEKAGPLSPAFLDNTPSQAMEDIDIGEEI